MLKLKKITEVIGKRVYTDTGDFFGEVEESNLIENKVDGWRVRVARDSNLAPFLGGAKGLIIPHQFVKAMGDVVVVSKAAVPSKEEDDMAEGPAGGSVQMM